MTFVVKESKKHLLVLLYCYRFSIAQSTSQRRVIVSRQIVCLSFYVGVMSTVVWSYQTMARGVIRHGMHSFPPWLRC